MKAKHLVFFVTEDWYFVSHRLPLAIAAKDAGMSVSVITRVRDHSAQIKDAGLRLIPFEHSRGGTNPVTDSATLLRLITLYRRVKPDIAHHVAMKPVLYGSIAAQFAGKPRLINALAGMGWLFTSKGGFARAMRPVVRAALKRVLRSGTALVQNPDDERILAELGVPNEQLRRIAGSGVDLQQFRPHPEPNGVPLVVLPARLLWNKGVGEFVAAARILARQGIAVRCVLAGEPDPQNPASVSSSQIQNWIGEGIVEYRGMVTDMPNLLASCHIVCLPSYREGLPKSLTEAAAAGRAVVTTDVPGCREAVTDGVTGLLVPPNDANAVAAAIARLIREPDVRRQMGAQGRLLAEQKFGSESVIRQTLALYEEAAT
ncbi:MAG: glycosyltransferase family 4 protein [Gemmatimonadaceae bacterium]